MRAKLSARRAGCLALLTVSVLAGCGSATEEKNGLTLDGARAHLAETAFEVVSAGVPGGVPVLHPSTLNSESGFGGSACGGPLDDWDTSIRDGFSAHSTKPAPHPGAALEHMRAKLAQLSYDASVQDGPDFQEIGFSNRYGDVTIRVFKYGDVEVEASTVCLDNPYR